MGSQLPLKGAQLLIFSSCLVSPDGVASSWMVSVSASVNLPLLISPCTVKSRSSLLAPVHPGGPGKRAVKPLCVYCGQTAGWMKTPLGTEADLGPGHIVLDGVPALRKRGPTAHPSFQSMSIVATVAHLSYC